MEVFPTDKVVLVGAKLAGINGNASIEIHLEPFELRIDDYQEAVETSIRLDGIGIPIDPSLLEEKVFEFPINPNDGYIDGSVYFLAVHNPVDVTHIEFGEIVNDTLPIVLTINWVLEFEKTGFKNFESILKTCIDL